MRTDDCVWASATDQARLVAGGQVSPAELVDAAIRRIERVDPALNAVIHERFDRARHEARGRLPDGPFRGVPMLVKDLGISQAGQPYHAGTRFLRRLAFRADHDSILTERFRAAGFVIVGRTNTPELAMAMTTEPEAYGPTRNPWSPDHSTGGSSGGSAAAVAAGLVAVAHANDGGGSIRIPASACGIVGLKPSRGRVTQGPRAGESWAGALIDGVVTRSVSDTAAVLDVISGYASGDPYVAPPFERPLLAEVGITPPPLRIGLLDHAVAGGAPLATPCRDAVTAAGELLAALGHRVEPGYPAALDEAEFGTHFGTMATACCAAELDHLARRAGVDDPDPELEPLTLVYAEHGRRVSAVGYLAAIAWLQRYARRVTSWWDLGAFDILVCPVTAGPPPPLGWLSDPATGIERTGDLLQYARQFNVSGQPAISLPLHWSAGGLPIGVQFVAAYGHEDLLIRLASQIEAARPWHHRRPDLEHPNGAEPPESIERTPR